jgi:flagellar protein FlaJ
MRIGPFEIKKYHIMGIVVALIGVIIDLIFLRGEKIFYFILGISVIIAALPFFVSFLIKTGKEKEKEEMFLEFSRNLVESVKSGTPISRSILNIKNKDYGSLTPHIDKLGNQIALGIPVEEALEIFAKDVNNRTIYRAVALIREAQQAGGEIETILESVAKSVSQTDELKKERKAAVYSLVVQGYIIFMIFIVIMLVLEFKILPMAGEFDIQGDLQGEPGLAGIMPFGGGEQVSVEKISNLFLYLLLTQGCFAGLIIGKLSEGEIKSGIKHSFILMALAMLISTGSKAFLG